MHPARAIKIGKYMEFAVGTDSIKNKIPYDIMHPNIFYTIDLIDNKFDLISEVDFDNYSFVCRLLKCNDEAYVFRALKTNKNEKVDFEEELYYGLSKII